MSDPSDNDDAVPQSAPATPVRWAQFKQLAMPWVFMAGTIGLYYAMQLWILPSMGIQT